MPSRTAQTLNVMLDFDACPPEANHDDADCYCAQDAWDRDLTRVATDLQAIAGPGALYGIHEADLPHAVWAGNTLNLPVALEYAHGGTIDWLRITTPTSDEEPGTIDINGQHQFRFAVVTDPYRVAVATTIVTDLNFGGPILRYPLIEVGAVSSAQAQLVMALYTRSSLVLVPRPGRTEATGRDIGARGLLDLVPSLTEGHTDETIVVAARLAETGTGRLLTLLDAAASSMI